MEWSAREYPAFQWGRKSSFSGQQSGNVIPPNVGIRNTHLLSKRGSPGHRGAHFRNQWFRCSQAVIIVKIFRLERCLSQGSAICRKRALKSTFRLLYFRNGESPKKVLNRYFQRLSLLIGTEDQIQEVKVTVIRF
ncbi:hypothetical protein AVEN_254358-1 [Araneus ventricosus]|uniref:Uncharacterized protein n=1 Tax=Araneus ventricosus TaxID=182803 RepID=A0A4Y2KGS0_ARAVE|nr:hypothetical protein AVEN_254358-1 [Araneus ventricosus]